MAAETGRAFLDLYVTAASPGSAAQPDILELVDGAAVRPLRSLCPPRGRHLVAAPQPADRDRGDPGIGDKPDVVLAAPHVLPFADARFDAVISTGGFATDPMFWVTFLDLLRVTRTGGHVFLAAPSNGWYGAGRSDSWRFYPDAGLSLEAWARNQGYALTLRESFTCRRRQDVWNDCAMVFAREQAALPAALVVDRFPDAMNIRAWPDTATLRNPCRATEDQMTIQALTQDGMAKDRQIGEMADIIDRYRREIARLDRRRGLAVAVADAQPQKPILAG